MKIDMRARYCATFLGTALFASAGFLALSCAAPELEAPLPSYDVRLAEGATGPFIIFGDSRKTLAAEFWRKRYDRERLLVIEAIAAEKPAFVLNTGDLVGHGSDPDDWRSFHEENRPIFSRKIPYYAGLGNHEYYGDNERALANYFSFFPHLEGRKWYEIRFPPVLVVVLDSNFGDLLPGEAARQDEWLSRRLAAAEADPAIRHVLVTCHHPPYTNSAVHGDDRDVQERFVRRLTPKVKAFISGHVHSYERFVRDGVQFVVSGGGGAPLTPVNVEKPGYRDEFRGPAYRRFHYLRFRADGGRLTCDVLMLESDGSWKRADGFECL
jgi:3',5'-cyclic AMP phosphodiesterase CpdA